MRAALVTPDGSAVVEHRVDRATRADLGVWRRAAATGAALGGSSRARGGRPLRPDVQHGAALGAGRAAGRDRVRRAGAAGRASSTRRSGQCTSIGPTGPVIGVTSDGAVSPTSRAAGYPVRASSGATRAATRRSSCAAPARPTMAGDRGRVRDGARPADARSTPGPAGSTAIDGEAAARRSRPDRRPARARRTPRTPRCSSSARGSTVARHGSSRAVGRTAARSTPRRRSMRRLLAIVARARGPRRSRRRPGRRPRPGPDLHGGLYTQNKVLQYRWTTVRHAAARHEGRDPRRPRTTRTPAASRRHRRSTTTRAPATSSTTAPTSRAAINGLACFRRDTPDWFGMWFRANGHRFDWGTLRWCELSGAPGRLLRRGEHRPRRVRPRARPRPPRELRRRQRLQGRRRPDLLADEAEGRLQRARLRAVRRRHAPAGSTTSRATRRSTAPASTSRPRSR